MNARLAVLAMAACLLAGCTLYEAATEPTDLYTVTPKSSFDPGLPASVCALSGRIRTIQGIIAAEDESCPNM